jgi:O-antigen ligase
MIDISVRESIFARIAGRLAAALAASARESFCFRLLLQSRILSFLTRYMPLVSGILTGLLFIIPHSLFNNLYSLLVLLALTGLLLLSVLNGEVGKIRLPRLGWYAALYWLLVLLGWLTSRNPSLSLRFFLFHLTAFLALIVTLSVLKDKRSVKTFLAPLLAAVSFSGLYGLLQSMTGIDIVWAQVDIVLNTSMPGRIFAFFDNPNTFAGILVLTLPFFAALFFSASSSLGKRIAFLAALPPAVALVLTFSRSGWMAFGLAVVVFFYFTVRWVVPLVFAAAIAALPFLPSTITDRLFSTFTGTDTSILYRTFVSDTYHPVISDYWLTGSGLGNDVLLEYLLDYYDARPHLDVVWWRIAPHTHSLYLQLWAEIGIVGVASFCGMMISHIKRCAATLFTATRKNFVTAAGLAGIAGILLMGYADYIWFYPRVLLLFWTVTGVTLASLRVEQEEQISLSAD